MQTIVSKHLAGAVFGWPSRSPVQPWSILNFRRLGGRGVCHCDPLAPSRLLTHCFFLFDFRLGSLRRSNCSWPMIHYNNICLKAGGYYSAARLVGQTYYSATPDGVLLRGPHLMNISYKAQTPAISQWPWMGKHFRSSDVQFFTFVAKGGSNNSEFLAYVNSNQSTLAKHAIQLADLSKTCAAEVKGV